MFKFLRCLFPILSVYAAIVCTICLCPSLPRLLSNEEIQFDYIGAIVGILSLLITFLLGWQILNVFNIDKIREDVKSQFLGTLMLTEESKVEIHGSLADYYHSTLEQKFSDEAAYRYVLNSLYLIIALNNLDEKSRTEANIETLLHGLNELKSIEVSKAKLVALKELIKKSTSVNANNTNELLNVVSYIKEKAQSK